MNISEFKIVIWDYTRRINESTHCLFNPVCEQYGLTMLQVGVLMQLFESECLTIGSLAECICAAGTNMSSMCKKLENMGLLKRVRDKNDERVVKVALTEKGNQVISDIDKYFTEKFSKNIENESITDLADIINGLQKLDELLKKIVSA